MRTPLDRLAELGLSLPPVAAPLASYVPARRSGPFVFTSGQLPFVDGVLAATGRVGDTVLPGNTVLPDHARELARLCALNALAAVHDLVGLDAVGGVAKVVGYVASDPGFHGQPGVLDGASELVGQLFDGGHARSAVGVAALPLGAPVEVELIVELA